MSSMTEDELRSRTRKLLEVCNPDDPAVDRDTFRGTQFDHGLAWVHFPEGLGGFGLSPGMQRVVDEEIRAGAKRLYHNMRVNPIGIGMGAPTVLAYGTDEMKQRFLRPLFTGEEVWSQLFSEPGAGSDVASLSTRALRDGDDWVVNGQKVWTTLAHVARWGMIVVRTDPDAKKHDGLTYFVLDMHAPGVEVRPLYQITAEAEFNEVFLTDVRIPQSMMLGVEGQGWRVAITTLMNERVAIGGASGLGRRIAADDLIDVWRERSRPDEWHDAVMRDRVTQLWIESKLLSITNQRGNEARRSGTPGPEGSVAKLVLAELNKKIYETCMDVLGEDALLYEPGFELRRPGEGPELDSTMRIKETFLRSRANSIEGGTSEVMRNILGERVLGLPGEPRVDKDVPWSDVPRSG